MRTPLCWMVGWLLLATGAGATDVLAPSSAARDYAVLGLEEVTLGTRVTVEGGDVGTNSRSGIVTLLRGVRVDGAVAGDTIRVSSRVEASELFCLTFVPLRGRAGGCQQAGLDLPLVQGLPIVEVDAGRSPLQLPRFATRTIRPLPYGAVRLEQGARLDLEGGTYDLRSLWVGPKAEVLCDGPGACLLRIQDRITLRRSARVGATPPLGPTDVRIEVRGGGRAAAVRAYGGVVVDGTLYAPNGGVLVSPNGRYTGAIVGQTVRILDRNRIKAASAL